MPSSSMIPRRAPISLVTREAMSCCEGGKASPEVSRRRSRIESSPTSWMFRPPTRTDRLSFFRRAPALRADVVGQGGFAPFVERRPVAQAVALGARPVGTVEGEAPGLELRQAHFAHGAEEGQGEEPLAALLVDDQKLARGELEGLVDGLRQPALRVRPDLDRVDQDLDGVLAVLFERDVVLEVAQSAVHPDPEKALPAEPLEQPLVLPLAALDDGRVEPDLHVRVALAEPSQDLLGRLRADLPAAARAVGRADPGEEQPEEVVDLGDRAHGRARVGRNGLLVDGDGRRDALDGFDLGLLHLVDELPGVGRQALDVAALALGEQGVEGQGRLPGAGRPGDDDQLVAGQRDVDGLQIVLGRPLDAYLVEHNLIILSQMGDTIRVTEFPGAQFARGGFPPTGSRRCCWGKGLKAFGPKGTTYGPRRHREARTD
jgi:hypothetical protein